MRLREKAASCLMAATIAAMSCPAIALAAETGTFASTLGDITGAGNSLLMTIARALLSLVAAVAFVMLAKEILPALGAREKVEFNRRAVACIVIIVICIIAAFTPTIIDAIVDLAGTGVDLGHVSQTS